MPISDDIKVGDLVATQVTGLYGLANGNLIKTNSVSYSHILFGHVVRKLKRNIGPSKEPVYHYRVMWDNGNVFAYTREEMEKYKKIIDDVRKSL